MVLGSGWSLGRRRGWGRGSRGQGRGLCSFLLLSAYCLKVWLVPGCLRLQAAPCGYLFQFPLIFKSLHFHLFIMYYSTTYGGLFFCISPGNLTQVSRLGKQVPTEAPGDPSVNSSVSTHSYALCCRPPQPSPWLPVSDALIFICL